MCLDSSLLPAARLYADLTGRRLHNFAGGAAQLPRVLALEGVDILIFRYADWTSDLINTLQRVADPLRRRPIGLIPALDLDDAFRQAVRRAAAVFLSQDPPELASLFCVGVIAGLPATAARAGNLALLGRDAPADLLEEALGCGTDVLAIATHSDGRDSPLPASRILCGIKERRRAFEGVEPLCVATGQCHRSEHMPIKDALGSSRLLAASSLRAKLLFFRACHMLLPTRDGIEAGDSLAQALLDRSVFGCLVSAVGVIFVNDLRLPEELAVLAGGGDVGGALARLARRDEAEPTRPNYLCFGDPRVMVGRAGIEPPPIARRSAKMGTASTAASAFGGGNRTIVTLEAVRDICLASLANSNERHDVENAWSQLIAACATDGQRGDIAHRFSECLRFVRREFTDGWMQAGASWRRLPALGCPHCGAQAQALACTFGIAQARRFVVNCVACGIALDRPSRLSSRVRISPHGSVIATYPTSRGSRLFLRIHSHQEQGPSIRELSDTALRFEQPVWSDVGRATPAQVSVLTIRGGDFAVASRNVILLPNPEINGGDRPSLSSGY